MPAEKQAHKSMPWEASFVYINNSPSHWIVREKKWGGKIIVDCGENGEKLARLIARAVNSHKSAMALLDEAQSRIQDLQDGNPNAAEDLGALAQDIRAALKSAGEEV